MEPLIAVLIISAAVGAYIGRGVSLLDAYLVNWHKAHTEKKGRK